MSRSARWRAFGETLPIRTRDRRVVPLKYNAPQERIWSIVAPKIDNLEPIRIICLKARREGISTLVESLLMTFIASADNVNALVTAHMKKPAQKIWGMSKLFVNRSPLLKRIATIGNSTITIGHSTLEVATAGSPESERGGDLTAWHACLNPETPVVFANGMLVPIEDARIGDLLRTHTGALARVRTVWSRSADSVTDRGRMIVVHPWLTGIPVIATPDHKFWTSRGWVPAGALRKGDELGTPIRPLTDSKGSIPLLAPVRHGGSGRQSYHEHPMLLTRERGFFFGYYLAEGSIHRQEKAPHRVGSIAFSAHSAEAAYGQRAIDAVSPWITSATQKQRVGPNTLVTTIYGTSLCELVVREFGDKDQKRIPDWVFDAPKEFSAGLIEGYICGDGSKGTDERTYFNARITVTSIRPGLLIQVRHLLASLGWGWAGLRRRNAETFVDARGWTNRPAWVLEINGRPALMLRERLGWALPAAGHVTRRLRSVQEKYRIAGDTLWVRVRSIGEAVGDRVFDLEVDHPDHSFETLIGAVANSEAAFYPHPEVMTATMQSLPHSKRIFSIGVIESTANGVEGDGEDFKEEWDRAEAGESEWEPIFLAFHSFPEYTIPNVRALEDLDEEEYELRQRFELTDGQLAWRRWAIANQCKGQVQIFRQEYPSCLVAETRISTEEGMIPLDRAAGHIVTESASIVGLYPQGRAPVFRVKTEAGRELVGTADHPLERVDGTFIDLGASSGERVSLRPPRFAQYEAYLRWETFGGVKTTLTVDERWGRFLGFFMGDGCYHDGTISISCDAQDTDVVEDVRDLLTHIIDKPTERRLGPNKGCLELRVGSVAFADLMRRLGIWHPDKPHRRVCVPEVIFRSPQRVVREFLRGLFEADGFNGYRCNRVVLFSKWPEFLRDVQLLLLGFGITAAIRERPTSTNGYAYIARTLCLRSAESVLFNEQIGFVGARKRGRGIPEGKGPRGRRPKAILLQDTVISVEPAGEAPVFDLSLRERHTFSANGIVVHNTAEEAFIQSGLPFFQPHELLWLDGHLREGTRYTVDPDGTLHKNPEGYLEIFKFPEPGHTYVVGADSSMGMPDRDDHKQHSRSAGCVLDMDTLEQVAEYDAASAPHIFARHLVGIGRLYNEALLAPEVQSSGGGGGREVLVYMRNEPLSYWNIHQWRGDPDKIRRQDSILYGWETNSKTRPRMLARIREVVMEKSCILHSRRLFKQLSAFGEDDHGHMEALAGRDDLLFAFGIGLMSRSENYWKTPAVTSTNPQTTVDWGALGIHVLQQETGQERMRRLLSSYVNEPHEKTFLES